MIVDPNEPQAQPLPNPSVMGADEIVGHVDRAMSSLPPEAHAAVGHAHELLGGGFTFGAKPESPAPSIPPMLAAPSPYTGNIDLSRQPIVKNPDGSSSTVRSISVGMGGKEMLIPTVAHDGSRILSNPEAIEQYRNSGKHLGAFDSIDDANRAAEQIHNDYESGNIVMSGGRGSGFGPFAGIESNSPFPIADSPLSQFGDPGFKPQELPSKRMIPERMKTLESPSMLAPTGNGEAPLPNARAVSQRTATLESPQSLGPQLSPYAPLPSPAATELKRLRDTGSGVSQIHNPFLKTLGTIADVIGSGFFPQFAQFVPGSSAHHQDLVGNKEAQVQDEQGQQKAADESALHQAQVDETHGRAAQEAARAEALTHPPDPKDWTQVTEPIIDPEHPELGPQVAYVNKNDPTKIQFLGKAGAKPTEAKQPTNELEAWVQAPENKGKPVADVLKHFWTAKADATGQEKSKPLTKDTAATLNNAWNSLASKYHMAENPFREGMSDSEVKHVQDSMNAIVGRNQGAQTIVVNQAKADAAKTAKQDQATRKEYEGVHKRLTAGFDKLVAQSDALDQADKEIGGSAPGQAVGTIKSIVGLAGGQGSGVRITQAELDSLVKARGLSDTFGGWISGIKGEGKMDAHQVQQIRDVIKEAKDIADRKRELYRTSLRDLSDAGNVKEVREIEGRFNDQMAHNNQPPDVKSQAEYDALPPGTVYMEDGKQYKKP